MTGNIYLDLAVSLAGIALLVAASWLLGGWRQARADAASAAERLGFDEPDFRPREWLVSGDGAAAVALSEDGAEIAVVFTVGDGLATRRMPRASARIAVEGAGVAIRLDDPSRRLVRLSAPDETAAKAWADALAVRAYN